MSYWKAVSGFVFTRTHALPAGPSVRLRLARPSDRDAIAALIGDDLAARRLVRFDPARRSVLAACAFVDGTETLVGVAAADHDHDAEVDTLVTVASGLDEVLTRALAARSDRAA